MSWSSTVRPGKKTLETVNQEPAKVGTDNPMRRVAVSLGDRRVVFIAEMLRVRSVLSAARGALRWLKEAALKADGGARRAPRKGISLSNVKAGPCNYHVRRVSGQPCSAR